MNHEGWVMRIGRIGNGSRSLISGRTFGYLALGIFLLTQATDGLFTYVGVGMHGVHAEANPIAARLMHTYGLLPTVTGIKVLTSSMGLALYVLGVPRILAFVAGVYLIAAVLPWASLLLLY